jgi:hypothetical protein
VTVRKSIAASRPRTPITYRLVQIGIRKKADTRGSGLLTAWRGV